MKSKGTLYLVPTPIGDFPLHQTTKHILEQAFLQTESPFHFVVEEPKAGRRRWLSYGLPREAVDHFQLLNEHNVALKSPELLTFLLKGEDCYLMSDCGLPAFYDPGQILVDLCHLNNVRVTSTPFDNSFVLALALSGFPHQQCFFSGYLPSKDRSLREKTLRTLFVSKVTTIFMDTPYRLMSTLEELAFIAKELRARGAFLFLAMDLCSKEERCLRGTPQELLSLLQKEEALQEKSLKREFVMVFMNRGNLDHG